MINRKLCIYFLTILAKIANKVQSFTQLKATCCRIAVVPFKVTFKRLKSKQKTNFVIYVKCLTVNKILSFYVYLPLTYIIAMKSSLKTKICAKKILFTK